MPLQNEGQLRTTAHLWTLKKQVSQVGVGLWRPAVAVAMKRASSKTKTRVRLGRNWNIVMCLN